VYAGVDSEMQRLLVKALSADGGRLEAQLSKAHTSYHILLIPEYLSRSRVPSLKSSRDDYRPPRARPNAKADSLSRG
jgi:hypothetical protein